EPLALPLELALDRRLALARLAHLVLPGALAREAAPLGGCGLLGLLDRDLCRLGRRGLFLALPVGDVEIAVGLRAPARAVRVLEPLGADRVLEAAQALAGDLHRAVAGDAELLADLSQRVRLAADPVVQTNDAGLARRQRVDQPVQRVGVLARDHCRFGRRVLGRVIERCTLGQQRVLLRVVVRLANERDLVLAAALAAASTRSPPDARRTTTPAP